MLPVSRLGDASRLPGFPSLVPFTAFIDRFVTMSLSSYPVFRCLLVEDNDDHAALVERFTERSDQPIQFTRLRDGEEACQFVRGEPPFKGERPHLIMLDLNLPKRSGHEVLETIKSLERCRSIPVVILSSSTVSSDIELAYRRHANSYLTKPTSLSQFRDLIADVMRYWGLRNLSPTPELS